MRYIHLTVHESDITIKKGLNINRVPLTSGSVNDIACRFEFSSVWESFPIKAAVFKGSGSTVTVAVTNNIVVIPWECLTQSGGELFVSVTGLCDLPETDSYTQLNTEELSLGVIVSGSDISSDATDNPPTPDIAEQLFATVNDIVNSENERKAGYTEMQNTLNETKTTVNNFISNTNNILQNHITESFYSDEGVHNFRIKDNFLEFYNGNNWEVITFKKNYRIMSAVIDLKNLHPSLSVSYADDATGHAVGGSDWDNFFGHYPALLENGIEINTLNTTNFQKYSNNTLITNLDGVKHDMCIAFPRRGIRIVKNNDKITVSMTDHPNLYGFDYSAHQLGNQEKDIFYAGIYKSALASDKNGNTILTSLPNKPIAHINDYFKARSYAENKNAKLFSYYQRLYIQCMFILKYKSLDSQDVINYGLVTPSISNSELTTGATDLLGMDSNILSEESKTSGIIRAKLFGLEDIWGSIYEWLGGIKTDASYIHASKADDSYEIIGSFNGNYNSGYISSVIGTNKCGFLPDGFTGSNTTRFTDWAVMNPNSYCIVGGDNTGGKGSGIFCIRLGENPNEENMTYVKSARIMYI